MARGDLRRLKTLRDAHERTGAELRDAEDRLQRARDNAREAVKALAALEVRAITETIDADELTAAKGARDGALAHLGVVEGELRAVPEIAKE